MLRTLAFSELIRLIGVLQTKEKLIILDRDGVINQDSDDFIKSPEEWHALPGSLEAIGELSSAGYKIYILTNQSGIARQYFSLQILERIHNKLIDQASQYGGTIDGIYFCPHGPNDNCDCRKPLTGLYRQLLDDLNQHRERPITSFNNVPSIGDSIRDLQAAKTAGAVPVLVKTGKGLKSKASLDNNPVQGLENIPCFESLADYVNHLLH